MRGATNPLRSRNVRPLTRACARASKAAVGESREWEVTEFTEAASNVLFRRDRPRYRCWQLRANHIAPVSIKTENLQLRL